jgi:hypothetical protein
MMFVVVAVDWTELLFDGVYGPFETKADAEKFIQTEKEEYGAHGDSSLWKDEGWQIEEVMTPINEGTPAANGESLEVMASNH